MTEAPGAGSAQAVQVRQTEGKLRAKTVAAVVLVVLPAVIFYAILFRWMINLPVQDDYEMILEFLNQMRGLKGVSAKASYFFAAQFNEYKVFLAHGIVWLQYAALGHVDFRLLCAIGNGFVVLLAILLWKMFLPEYKDTAERLMLFVPVSWLVFQLHYVETLNWAGPGLQNIPVVPFSLAAIYFLVRTTPRAYGWALACLVLAIASSGNALFVVPVGVLILLRRHLYARLTGWLTVSAGCIAVYFYRYNFMSSQSPTHHSIFATLLHASPLFLFTFLGGAVAPLFYRQGIVLICALAGLTLCVFFFAMIQRGYFRRNPAVGYCVLFVLLTAAGVTGIRSEFGVEESLSSRYGMYPMLLVIFAWFALAEEFLLRISVHARKRVLTGLIVVVMLFSLTMDHFGWRGLRAREGMTLDGMKAFEHSVSSRIPVSPVPVRPHQEARIDELDRDALVALQESMRLGIYQPPQL
jgi:hypothetical protein